MPWGHADGKSERLQFIRRGALAAGYSTEQWTLKRIAHLIRRHFGVRYYYRYLERPLKAHGFTPQRPAVQAKERDDAVVRAWLKRDWPALKKLLNGIGEIMFPKSLEAFIPPMLAMAETQFPRVCNACQHPYRNFKQFVQGTKPIGAPTIMLDAETDPIGMMSWTNCVCGNTLIVSCEGRDEDMHNEFTRVLKAEAQASGLPIKDLLLAIRAEVRRRMLKDDAP